MKCNFILNQEAEFNHLVFEIESAEKVKSYGLKSILPPENIISEYVADPKNTGLPSLKDYFNKNYKVKEYKKVTQEAKLAWESKEELFFDALNKIIKSKITHSYEIYITLFGPGGSYTLPDAVFVRGVTEEDKEYFDVCIAHEIIHLNVEEKVKELKLSHNGKELLVDAILFQPEIARIFGLKNEKIKTENKYYNNLGQIFGILE